MLNAEEIKQLYEGWKSAIANGKLKALDVICDTHFTWTTANGHVRDKAQTLEWASAGDIAYESWTSSEHRVHFYGNTAVLNCRDQLEMIREGRTAALEQRAMAVFFRQDNSAWKLVGTQSTDMAPEDEPG